MSLLRRVVETLDAAGIVHALIGAGAMSQHGVSRATVDLDLFTTQPAALAVETWKTLREAGAAVEVREGDLQDPLAGVVRLRRGSERPVDVVVGKRPWQQEIAAEAQPGTVDGVAVRVARPLHLVLLKLYAAGPQDAWDVHELLAGEGGEEIVSAVEARIERLPRDSRALWRRILEEGREPPPSP